MIVEFWDKISHFGTETASTSGEVKRIIYCNRIALSLFFISILVSIFVIGNILATGKVLDTKGWINTFRIMFMGMGGVVTLLFNRYKLVVLGKYVLSLAPIFFLLVFPIFTDRVTNELLLIIPISFLALSSLSIFIFSFSNERWHLISILAIYILYILFYEHLYFNQTNPPSLFAIISENRYIFKLTQLFTFLYFCTIIFIVLSHNFNIYKDITHKNSLLEEFQEELTIHNEQLKQKQWELESKNKELEDALSQLKATQSQLVQSEKMASLGTLTAGIAHEINNPVNFISGSLQAFEGLLQTYQNETNTSDKLDKKEFNTKLERLLKNSKNGTKRIQKIVEGLLVFSHKGTENKRPSNIQKIIESTLSLIQFKISENTQVLKEFTELPEVICYRDKLHQVVLNILDNAIYATNSVPRETHSIKIKTSLVHRNGSSYAEIEISNSGPSIPKALLAQLFDPFFTTKEPGEGTGLGLSISYNIIKEHEGFLEVRNNDIGVSFSILLPL
ncbi:ATP-binding protein [Flammeovirgaceae bacterium SG7u.111]|nr:ATP-binding protein [Flammeovirgaceae bacterium SG7u.132]WPO33239.1 ATP-binding protein [Flammeovirgaceae bacterium SG7u.111]